MKYVFKGLSAVILLALSFSYASAEMVNFTLTGTVTYRDYSFFDGYASNPFGLETGDTITASGSYDNAGFDDFWAFNYADLIDVTFEVGTGTYTLEDGDSWPSPEIVFYYGSFYDLDYSSADGEFYSSFDTFSGDFWNFEGNWHSYEEVSAVPVPAAAWLFGSGLIGLVGLARRNKSIEAA